MWLTGPTSSVLVIATPRPGGGGGGEQEGRDLLQQVELTWASTEKPPKATIIGNAPAYTSYIPFALVCCTC